MVAVYAQRGGHECVESPFVCLFSSTTLPRQELKAQRLQLAGRHKMNLPHIKCDFGYHFQPPHWAVGTWVHKLLLVKYAIGPLFSAVVELVVGLCARRPPLSLLISS